MKKIGLLACLLLFTMFSVESSFAAPRIYKWVKDKRVSSDQTLSKSQSSRVLPISEGNTLEMVKSVMTDDLFMALGDYHKSRNCQDAETTPDTVLPEEVIKREEIELVDEDYRFVLEVSLKKYGNRTRVQAKAVPVYRLRDHDAEAAAGAEDESGHNVEVKIKSNEGSGVFVGPIVVAPIYGMPSDYGIQPLPDAGQRAGKLVRSFMYFLDKKVSVLSSNGNSDDEATDDLTSVQKTSQEQPVTENETEVEINIK